VALEVFNFSPKSQGSVKKVIFFAGKYHSTNDCLYSAIYYEANTESLIGKRAVLDVILHRMKHEGKSACAIVKAKHQFSWYPKKRIKKVDNTYLKEVLEHKPVLPDGFRYFHSTKVKPKWKKRVDLCIRIGGHVFCRIK